MFETPAGGQGGESFFTAVEGFDDFAEKSKIAFLFGSLRDRTLSNRAPGRLRGLFQLRWKFPGRYSNRGRVGRPLSWAGMA